MIDLSPIIASFLSMWWLIPIIVVILFFKSSIGKGIVGESILNFLLKIALNNKEYQVLHNITLTTENGTTQIDHIIVSIYGIFVIETKNYKGWIFGRKDQKTWTQSIYGKKNSFQNPLHQNYKHLKVLQTLLNLQKETLFSVVVFVGEATFKTDMPENVVYPMGLIRFIKSQNKILYSRRDMWRNIEVIEEVMLKKGFQTNQEHVRNLQKTYEAKEAFSSVHQSNSCPRCNGELVLRIAKKGPNMGGEFYGCNNYPRCKYTHNI